MADHCSKPLLTGCLLLRQLGSRTRGRCSPLGRRRWCPFVQIGWLFGLSITSGDDAAQSLSLLLPQLKLSLDGV